MNLYADLRWPVFAERYASDVNAFARDVCNLDLGERLAEPSGLLGRGACRLAVHNAGDRERQGLVLAVMALWHIATRPVSTTVLAYPLGTASQTNQAIGQVLAHIRTGAHYWLARGIKHRAGGWFAGGAVLSTIELRRLTPKDTDAVHGIYSHNLLWLVEDGDRLRKVCLEAILSTLLDRANGLVIACNWYVPRCLMSLVRERSASPWSLIDMGLSSKPAPAEQQNLYQVEVREFIELVAGKPLTSLQVECLADLLQDAPPAQTPA